MSQPTSDRRHTFFTLDRAYFRKQAREALRTFFAPLSGVYAALREPLPPRD